MLDVVIYIYPMGREEFDTLHVTLKGIKEESTHRDQAFFQQILYCSGVIWQRFNVLSRDGSVILSSTPVCPTWKTGAPKPRLVKQTKTLAFYHLTHFRCLPKMRRITLCFSPLLLKIAR